MFLKPKNFFPLLILVCIIFFLAITSFLVEMIFHEELLISAVMTVIGYFIFLNTSTWLEKRHKEKKTYFFYRGCIASGILHLTIFFIGFIFSLSGIPNVILNSFILPLAATGLSLSAIIPAIHVILDIINDIGNSGFGGQRL